MVNWPHSLALLVVIIIVNITMTMTIIISIMIFRDNGELAAQFDFAGGSISPLPWPRICHPCHLDRS